MSLQDFVRGTLVQITSGTIVFDTELQEVGAFVNPRGTIPADHATHGGMTHEPVGRGGYGYDPVLRTNDSDRALADLAPEVRDANSHRGLDLRRRLPAAVDSEAPAA